MNFSTYGPFLLEEMSSSSIDNLFNEIRTARADLQYAIGIYVVAARDNDGQLVPWYVGKTDNEFGIRLIQHVKAQKFDELASRVGPLSLFLIAHVTNKGKIKKVTENMRQGPGL